MNPRDAKMMLAEEIVTRYHGVEAAAEARAAWEKQFQKREVPDDMPEVTVSSETEALWIPKALAEAGLVKSSSEGRRRVQQGAVEVDGERVTDAKATLAKGGRYVVKAGKRAWAAIRVD
ncbi:MAG: S4 domain-containing protein, partial [Polyangiales bacterium]